MPDDTAIDAHQPSFDTHEALDSADEFELPISIEAAVPETIISRARGTRESEDPSLDSTASDAHRPPFDTHETLDSADEFDLPIGLFRPHRGQQLRRKIPCTGATACYAHAPPGHTDAPAEHTDAPPGHAAAKFEPHGHTHRPRGIGRTIPGAALGSDAGIHARPAEIGAPSVCTRSQSVCRLDEHERML